MTAGLNWLMRLHHLPVWARYGLSAAIVLVAFGLGAVLAAPFAGRYPFLTFFPAVLLCAGLFDRGSGILAVGLSTALSAVIVEPGGRMAVAGPGELLALIIFFVIALIMALIVEGLRKALEKLALSVAELKKANERLARGEEEKELLLRELAHRSQNSLQSVSSLLHMQAGSAELPAMREALLTAARRVQVMGLVQARLNRSDGEVAVDCRSFIGELCDDLRASLVDGRPVELQVDVEGGLLPVARAVPIGLAVNELVGNALKYAFPDGRAGSISVRLRLADDTASLEVADDGVGMPATTRRGGLGQRLVKALAGAGGDGFRVSSGTAGTRCTVSFAVNGTDST